MINCSYCEKKKPSYQDNSVCDAACTLCPLTSLCGSVPFVATHLVMEYYDEILIEFSFLQKDKILFLQFLPIRQVLQTFGYFHSTSVDPLLSFLNCRTRTGNIAPGAV